MASDGNTFNQTDRLAEYTDEQLAAMCKEGSISENYVSELIYRYFGFIKSKASQMCQTPSSYDDFVQEGLLGFLNAVKNYNSEKEVPFSSFAYVCVINRMKSAAKKLSSFNNEENDNNENVKSNITPESIIIQREFFDDINNSLTPLECDIFRLYITGLSYEEIAARKKISAKSADNAVQRARRKLRKIFTGKIF